MELKDTQRIEPLDSLRGIAALLVLVYHLKFIFDLPLHTYPGFIIGRMALGVPLFFTLSSFSIFYSLKSKEINVKTVQHYFIRRFFRIAPLYYFLIFIYSIRNFESFSYKFISNLLLNLSFSFGFSPKSHEGIVPAGWSIGIEFIIYFLLPTLICLIRDYKTALLAFILSCIISVILSYEYSTVSYAHMSYSYKNIIVMLPFFFLGILLFYIYLLKGFQVFIKNNMTTILIMLLVSFIVIYIIYYLQKNISGSLIELIIDTKFYLYISIPFFFLVVIMQLGNPLFLLHNRLLNYAGKWSYSIYLIHPFVILTSKDLYFYIYSFNLNSTLSFLICLIYTLTIVSFLSYFSYKYIELRGIKLGKQIISKL